MVKVLVIGDAILDRYVYGRINRQSPEDATISVLDMEKEEYRLGGCMNVAANLRSISKSFEVHLSSIFSSFTGRMLYNKGIRCDDSNMMEERRAGDVGPCNRELIKTRVINLDTGRQLIRIDNRLKYDDQDIELYKSVLGDIDDSFDAVVVSDYAKGLVNGFTLEKLKDFKGPVFVDSKNPDLAFWNDIPKCMIKVNNKELNEATSATKHLLVVTMGSHGCDLYRGNTLVTHARVPKQILEFNADVVGAGDVFLAGLVTKYLLQKDCLDIDEAMQFANMVAGISIQQQGTTEVWL